MVHYLQIFHILYFERKIWLGQSQMKVKSTFHRDRIFRKEKGMVFVLKGSPFLKSDLCIWTLPVFWGGGELTLARVVCCNILSTSNWAICFVLGEVRTLVKIAGRVQNLCSRFYCHGVNQKKNWSKKHATRCLFDRGVKNYLGNAQIHGPLFKKGLPYDLLFIGKCNTLVMLAIK